MAEALNSTKTSVFYRFNSDLIVNLEHKCAYMKMQYIT